MSNDKGCLCCLPSELAPILFGLFNFANIVLWVIDWNPIFALIGLAGFLVVLMCFVWRTSACARLILLLAYLAESIAVLYFAWMITALANSE